MRSPIKLAGLLVGASLLAVLAACGTQRVTVGHSPTAAASPPATSLTISVRQRPDAQTETWTLRCAPPGGSHPNPAGACAALAAAAAKRDPFAPVPKNAMCTQIYGGPQQAWIKGTWQGKPVDATYSRVNGCEIARWNAIGAVLEATHS